jgi:hypothetical protein
MDSEGRKEIMLYEFICPKGHTTERLLPIYRMDETVLCQQCGEPMKRNAISSPARITVDLGMPPWAPDWIKKTEKRVFSVGG